MIGYKFRKLLQYALFRNTKRFIERDVKGNFISSGTQLIVIIIINKL